MGRAVTAVEPLRHPAGSPVGGRFAPRAAPAACSTVYALLDGLAAAAEPEDGEVVYEDGVRTTFHVRRCPHGHTRRWADRIDPATKSQPNCRGCHPPRNRPRSPSRRGDGG